ncbi:hypothetical protein DQ226_18550 [Dietzia maris]|uniref:Uncharacterized protein n=1 Tax=Dietzia maris TaxID=37915 RepID=A0A365P3I3_9ACTN|nr:hypothetical protein DQ226_18550 [Dietzia maris]
MWSFLGEALGPPPPVGGGGMGLGGADDLGGAIVVLAAHVAAEDAAVLGAVMSDQSQRLGSGDNRRVAPVAVQSSLTRPTRQAVQTRNSFMVSPPFPLLVYHHTSTLAY